MIAIACEKGALESRRAEMRGFCERRRVEAAGRGRGSFPLDRTVRQLSRLGNHGACLGAARRRADSGCKARQLQFLRDIILCETRRGFIFVPFKQQLTGNFANEGRGECGEVEFSPRYLIFSKTSTELTNGVRRQRGCLPWAPIRVSVQSFPSGPQDRRIGRRCSMAFGLCSKNRLRKSPRGAAFSLRFKNAIVICAVLGAGALLASQAAAQDPIVDQQSLRAEQARLADHIRLHPTDYEATYRYVVLSTELKDYEAGIGALERLLTFNPGLSRARKELGLLYARLGAYQIAAQHLRRALQSGDLDAAQVAQIESHLPDIEKQSEASRWYGRIQIGVRSQSNASYFPSSDLFRVGGFDRFGVPQRRADFNAFELGEFAHDYDFQNQRGDRFETRISGYATQQFNLSQYNVGLLSVSAGPRLALEPDMLPGVTVKPYVTGLVSSLGNINYLNSGGAGFNVNVPVGPIFSVEPGFEWRALSVNTRGVSPQVSTLSSGDAIQASLAGYLRPLDDVRIETRLSYTRGDAHNAAQSFDQFEAQGALRVEFDPPFDLIGRKWSIAPYGRVFQIQFDQPNFFLDPFRARRDVAWTTGLAFEAPVTANFGFASAIEYSRNWSNLPNFNTNNLSVIFGPVAKF